MSPERSRTPQPRPASAYSIESERRKDSTYPATRYAKPRTALSLGRAGPIATNPLEAATRSSRRSAGPSRRARRPARECNEELDEAGPEVLGAARANLDL